MTAANEPSSSAGSPDTPANPPADWEAPSANLETGIKAESPAPVPEALVPPTAGPEGEKPNGEAPRDADAPIPLPPLPVKCAPLTPERLAAEITLLDRILVGGVLLL